MRKIKWYYTESLTEASSLLREKNILPHGGGTNLINRKFTKETGLLDLKKLNLDNIIQEENVIKIGSMSTYADIVSRLKLISPNNILVKSLENSANTPLRNRITIGGSIGFVPKWSDLIGALLALDAKVVLIGQNDGEFQVSDYINNKKLREKSLITTIQFTDFSYKSSHYRNIKTKSDMPLFTVTTLFKMDNEKISDAKIFIGGTIGRISKITKLEYYLQNKTKEQLSEKEITNLIDVKFSGNRVTNPDYLSEKAKIETYRAIIRAMESN